MIEDDHEEVSDYEALDQDEDEEQEQEQEQEQVADEDDDEEQENPEEVEQEAQESEADEEVAPTPVRGARGRPRGRGRGISRGRPRGRGRGGRGLGRGRGRKSGIIVLRNPNYNAQAADDAGGERGSSVADTPGMDIDDEGPPVGGEKWVRVINGVSYETDGEELTLPTDPHGETKIDGLGNLQGGRKFKGSTFTSAIRPNPQKRYILSIEAARATGYRDSLYYFRRNPLLVKITLTQSEKDILIADKILSQNLRSRIVTMVTAKSAFMMGGAKLVRDGKWVDDDYYEDKAREECLAKGCKPGDPVGEVGDNTFDDPNRAAKLAALAANAVQKEATSADRASAVYKTGGPTTFFGSAGLGPFAGEMPSSKKALLSRDDVTETNWMHLMAQKVVEANEIFAKMRKERLEKVPMPGGPPPTSAPAAPQPLKTQASVLAAAESTGTPRGTPGPSSSTSAPEAAPPTPTPAPMSMEGLSQSALRALSMQNARQDGASTQRKQKRSQAAPQDESPKGVYEPHTGLIHYRQDTQPTRSKMERVYGPEAEEKSVLGGTMTGSGAWGLVWIDTYAETRDYTAEKEEEMRRLYEQLSQ